MTLKKMAGCAPGMGSEIPMAGGAAPMPAPPMPTPQRVRKAAGAPRVKRTMQALADMGRKGRVPPKY